MKKQIFSLEFSKFKQKENKLNGYIYSTSDESTIKFQSVLEPFSRRTEKPAIVIDNGSYETRAGWNLAVEEGPYLRSRAISAKPKNFQGCGSLTKSMNDMILVGNELIDYDTNREGVKKSMFDKNAIF